MAFPRYIYVLSALSIVLALKTIAGVSDRSVVTATAKDDNTNRSGCKGGFLAGAALRNTAPHPELSAGWVHAVSF